MGKYGRVCTNRFQGDSERSRYRIRLEVAEVNRKKAHDVALETLARELDIKGEIDGEVTEFYTRNLLGFRKLLARLEPVGTSRLEFEVVGETIARKTAYAIAKRVEPLITIRKS